MNNNSKGNVLFLILIAVALFAALSYAVTQSTRSGGGDVSSEKMSTAFAEIQNAIVAHRMAYQRLVMAGNNPDTGIDDYWRGNSNMWADYSYVDANENSSTCSMIASCSLYLPEGGSITPFNFVDYSPYGHFTGTYSRFATRRTWWSFQGTELIDTIFRGEVTPEFCQYYNQRLGINANLLLAANQFTIATGYDANGDATSSLPHTSVFANAGSQAAHLHGHDNGCAKAAGVEQYFVFAVIYPR